MVNIYLARHGQNEDNVQGILNGHRDKPLTALGVQQAKTTANFLVESGIQFAQVYTSPLVRAAVTAEIITDTLELDTPTILPDLIERNFGLMTGKLATEIKKLCAPEILETETVTYFLSPPEAETFPDLLKRAQRLINTIQTTHADDSVLLVTHGDMGKMIYAAYYQLDWKTVLTNFHFGNCEVLQLTSDSAANEAHLFVQEQHNH
jgi:broad specificity phosphatase PhoE